MTGETLARQTTLAVRRVARLAGVIGLEGFQSSARRLRPRQLVRQPFLQSNATLDVPAASVRFFAVFDGKQYLPVMLCSH
jgi:hypothetical protein